MCSPGRALGPDVCACVASPTLSLQKVPLMSSVLALQPPHAVHPAAPALRSHQHPAAGAAAGHGHAHHAALAPRHRHPETTAPHHGPGEPAQLLLLLLDTCV